MHCRHFRFNKLTISDLDGRTDTVATERSHEAQNLSPPGILGTTGDSEGDMTELDVILLMVVQSQISASCFYRRAGRT